MSGERLDMSEAEWQVFHSVLPRKHRGPKRVQDRRVMNGIFFVLRTGTPWRDLPERFGPYTTCYNRDNPWSRNGIRASIMEELQRLAGDDGGSDDGSAGSGRLRMVDSSSVRVHRQGAGAPRDGGPPRIGSSRGGRTTKVHLGIDDNAMVKTVFLSPGQAADSTQAIRAIVSAAAAAATLQSCSRGAADPVSFILIRPTGQHVRTDASHGS